MYLCSYIVLVTLCLGNHCEQSPLLCHDTKLYIQKYTHQVTHVRAQLLRHTNAYNNPEIHRCKHTHVHIHTNTYNNSEVHKLKHTQKTCNNPVQVHLHLTQAPAKQRQEAKQAAARGGQVQGKEAAAHQVLCCIHHLVISWYTVTCSHV